MSHDFLINLGGHVSVFSLINVSAYKVLLDCAFI